MAKNEETQVTDEVEEEAFEIPALFADDLEEEVVDVPGHAGSWIKIRQMDADAYGIYMQSHQSFSCTASKDGTQQFNINVDVNGKEMALLMGSIVDCCFVVKKRDEARKADTTEQIMPPASGKGREMFMRNLFKEATPPLRQWMVKQCEKVNNITLVDLDGNPLQEGEEIDISDLTALFASDLKPVRVDVPGELGWVELKPMNAEDYALYVQSGEKYIMRNNELVRSLDVEMQVAAQELALLKKTVKNYCFKKKKRDEDGKLILENGEPVLTEVKPANVKGKFREREMDQHFKKLTPQFRQWLVIECLKVNGLDGNSEKKSQSVSSN